MFLVFVVSIVVKTNQQSQYSPSILVILHCYKVVLKESILFSNENFDKYFLTIDIYAGLAHYSWVSEHSLINVAVLMQLRRNV